MKNKKLIWVIVLIVLIGVLFVLKTQNNKSDLMKVGMISILSGEYSVVGENFRNGALLAQEEYNLKNPDKQIPFVAEDDGFDSKKALSAYQKLVGIDHINSLINVSSPSIGAIYDLVTKTEIPVIQGGEQTTEPTDDNVFQVLPGSIDLERQLGAYIKEKGFKNPVVVYTNNDTIIRFKNALIQGFGAGIKEVSIKADEKDFGTHVLKVSSEKPDIVVVIMFPESGAQFVKRYASLGNLPRLAFDANVQSGLKDYQRILDGGSVLDGSIVAIIPQSSSPEFISAYKKRFGIEPGFMSDVGYDAFNLLVKTYDRDGKKWIENIKNVQFTGASGPIEFDNVGVRKPEVKFVEMVGGELPN